MDFSGWYSFYGGEQVGSFDTTYGNLIESAIRSLRDYCEEPEMPAMNVKVAQIEGGVS